MANTLSISSAIRVISSDSRHFGDVGIVVAVAGPAVKVNLPDAPGGEWLFSWEIEPV